MKDIFRIFDGGIFFKSNKIIPFGNHFIRMSYILLCLTWLKIELQCTYICFSFFNLLSHENKKFV